VTELKTGWHSEFGVGQGDGAKDEPLAGRSLETGFRFLDRRVSFQCGLQNAFQSNAVSCKYEAGHPNWDSQSCGHVRAK
jgi:hypothetical protein